MNTLDMLTAYRARANPMMLQIVAEFRAMSTTDQRELLFCLIVDTATNPTRPANVTAS